MVGECPDFLAAGIHGLLVHGIVHVARQFGHQSCQRVLLQFAQHAVEVKVVELQEQVGGDKRREARVVVLLVDVEQLAVAGGHDGEAVLSQLLAQQRVEVLELCGVDEVLHVHAQSFLYLKVPLLQFVLSFLQPLHEGQFLVGVLNGTRLFAGPVVVVAPRLIVTLLDVVEVGALLKLPRQRVVPRRRTVDTSEVGILEGVALAGGWGVAQHAQVADAESRNVHVVVDVLVQLLHVDMRHGHLYHTLFLAARRHQAGDAHGEECLCFHRLKYLIAVSLSVPFTM